jgi:hypothetical protein
MNYSRLFTRAFDKVCFFNLALESASGLNLRTSVKVQICHTIHGKTNNQRRLLFSCLENNVYNLKVIKIKIDVLSQQTFDLQICH